MYGKSYGAEKGTRARDYIVSMLVSLLAYQLFFPQAQTLQSNSCFPLTRASANSMQFRVPRNTLRERERKRYG